MHKLIDVVEDEIEKFKELRKADFGDSILKDFLNDYGFKNQQDLENKFPIFKDLDKLQESDLVEKIQYLIKNPDEYLKAISKKNSTSKGYYIVQGKLN